MKLKQIELTAPYINFEDAFTINGCVKSMDLYLIDNRH
jgi:hypothetical protein